ncbi:MAG: cell division protein FtsQ/DivIB [Bacillota bacterium]
MSQNRFLAYIITFISIIAIISFILSPFFQVRSIEFQGLKILTQNDFNTVLNPYYNSNILFLDHRKMNKKIAKNKYVKNVDIIKNYPDTIMINIKEREPIALISNNGEYVLFTVEGVIVEIDSDIKRVDVPEIKGLGYSLKNNDIFFSSIFEEIVQALDKISVSARTHIKYILYNEDQKLISEINEGIKVYLGSPEYITKKFNILQSVITKINNEDLNVEYIDLSIYKKPVIKLK